MSIYYRDSRRSTYAPVVVLATIAAVLLLWLGQLASVAMDGIGNGAATTTTDTSTYNGEDK